MLGGRAIAKGFRQAGEEPPVQEELYREAMGGDMVVSTRDIWFLDGYINPIAKAGANGDSHKGLFK